MTLTPKSGISTPSSLADYEFTPDSGQSTQTLNENDNSVRYNGKRDNYAKRDVKLLTEGKFESELESGGSWSDGSGNIESKLVDEAIRNWDIEEDFSMVMFGQTLSGTKYHRGNTSDTLKLQKETTVTGETESSTHTGKRTMTGTETKGVTAANGTLLSRTASFSESESQNTVREITYDYDEQAETWAVSGGSGAFSGSRSWSYLYNPADIAVTIDINSEPNTAFHYVSGTEYQRRRESGCYSDSYFGTESYDIAQDSWSAGFGFGSGSGFIGSSWAKSIDGEVTQNMITPQTFAVGTYKKAHVYTANQSFAGVFTLSGGQWNSVWTGEDNRTERLVVSEIASGSCTLFSHRTDEWDYNRQNNYQYSETENWIRIGNSKNILFSRTKISDTKSYLHDQNFVFDNANYNGGGNRSDNYTTMKMESDKTTVLGATIWNCYNNVYTEKGSSFGWNSSYSTAGKHDVTASRSRFDADFSIVNTRSVTYTRTPGFTGYVPESIPETTTDTLSGPLGGGLPDAFPYLAYWQGGVTLGVSLNFNGGGVGVTFSETPVTLPSAGITHDYDKYIKRPPEKPYTPDMSGVTRVDPTWTNTIMAVGGAFGLGFGQGALNTVNGTQDAAIGLANLVALGPYNLTSYVLNKGLGTENPYVWIPSPDWSRGLLTEEYGEPGTWSDTHGWSKFFGGVGVTSLVSAAQLSRLNALRAKIPANGQSVLDDAMFAQKTYGPKFGPEGPHANRPINEVVEALKSGKMKPNDLPIDYGVIDGHPIIVNTRSAQALEQAGIPRANWSVRNISDDIDAMNRLNRQLSNNKLTPPGYPKPRLSGQ